MPLIMEVENFNNKFERFNDGNNPGLAVLAIKNGNTVFKNGYGLRNLETKEKINTDTNFRIASLTKQFTAMAIAILEEQNKVNSEEHITEYFSDFPEYGKGIKVKHLIHHLSGLPDYDKDLCSSDRNTKPFTNKDVYNYLKKKTKLDFRVGSRFEYSNTGYNILGSLIEIVSGLSYKEFIEKHIFQSANMHSSIVIDYPEPEIKNRAFGYSEWPFFELNDYNSGNFVYGEDGIYTSIDDIANWINSIEKNLIISSNIQKRIFSGTKTNQGDLVDYGYGWGLRDFMKHKMFCHSGSWVGFNTMIANFPEQKLWLVTFSNTSAISSINAFETMAACYLQEN